MADETNQNQATNQPEVQPQQAAPVQPQPQPQVAPAQPQPQAAPAQPQQTQPSSASQATDAAKNAAKDAVAKVKSIGPERGWAMACYIPVFNILICALALVRMANSKFCRLHARQGLALFLLWFITIIVALFSPGLSLMLWGVVIVLHIAGFVLAFRSKEVLIPIIGMVANKIPEFFVFELLTGKNPEKDAATKAAVQPQATTPQVPTENKPN